MQKKIWNVERIYFPWFKCIQFRTQDKKIKYVNKDTNWIVNWQSYLIYNNL